MGKNLAILLNFKTPKFIGESSVNSRFFLNLGARRFCFFRRSVLLSLLAIPINRDVLKQAAQSGLKISFGFSFHFSRLPRQNFRRKFCHPFKEGEFFTFSTLKTIDARFARAKNTKIFTP